MIYIYIYYDEVCVCVFVTKNEHFRAERQRREVSRPLVMMMMMMMMQNSDREGRKEDHCSTTLRKRWMRIHQGQMEKLPPLKKKRAETSALDTKRS